MSSINEAKKLFFHSYEILKNFITHDDPLGVSCATLNGCLKPFIQNYIEMYKYVSFSYKIAKR